MKNKNVQNFTPDDNLDQKWLYIIGIIALSLITIFIIISSADKELDATVSDSTPTVAVKEKSELQKPEVQQKKKNQIPEKKETKQVQSAPTEPRLLGKWFSKRNVYLAKEGSKYVATFDPPLSENSLIIPPTSSDPIYPYLVGLLNEVWGLLPSQLSNPQFAPPLVFYENYASGEKFLFLLFKDETTGAVFGVSFWKE